MPGAEEMAVFVQMFDSLVNNVTKVLHGKEDVVRAALTCVLAEGHLLIEDVPGVGKTSLGPSHLQVGQPDLEPRPVHARPLAQRHHRGDRLRPGHAPASTSARARCSPTSSSVTR